MADKWKQTALLVIDMQVYFSSSLSLCVCVWTSIGMWVVASEVLHEFVVGFCGFQNDFILEDGLMRVNGGEAIVPNVIKAVEIARHRGVLVVWVIFFCFLLILGKQFRSLSLISSVFSWVSYNSWEILVAIEKCRNFCCETIFQR